MRPLIRHRFVRTACQVGGLAALLGAGRAEQTSLDGLTGRWQLTETYPPLLKARNPQALTISTVEPARTNYTDGSFRFVWVGDTTAYRGYYRGTQIWFISPRRIGRKTINVIYSGRLSDANTWVGQARPDAMPDAPHVPVWNVTAKRSL